MLDKASWDWETGEKLIADIDDVRARFSDVHELVVRADGEKIAVPVKTEDGSFTVCVNGEPWENVFELAWYLKFSPDGRLTALVKADDQWTVGIDDKPWEEKFEYVWNTQFSGDGKVVAAQAKREMDYLVVVDGSVWSNQFISTRGLVVSQMGETVAAVVQPVPLKEADIFGFLEGTWTLAVNDRMWDKNYINVYAPAISPDGSRVAAEVRLDLFEYTVAVDGRPWEERFGCVWEPLFRGRNGSVLVPARIAGSWTLAENGKPIWNGSYAQLWCQRVSPDGTKVLVKAIEDGKYSRRVVALQDIL